MPWELTISAGSGEPLGDRQAVVDHISTALPSLQWFEQPPLLEQIKEIPDHPFHKLIPAWPPEIQASFARSKLLGDLEADDFSIQLYGFEEQPLLTLSVEVRGDGNPIPALASICVPKNWLATENGASQQIDFGADAEGWQKFRDDRDTAIRTLWSG